MVMGQSDLPAPTVLIINKAGRGRLIMEHHFNIDLAARFGILEAIILNNLQFWLRKNAANNANFFDGSYWTYNSVHAYAELFPYASEKQIRTALKKLVNAGILKTGNYNKSAYDRTLWYAFTDEGLSICPIGKMEEDEKANQNDRQGEPIPYINQDNKTIEKPNIIEQEFEELWNEYPRKEGKKNAFKAYEKARKQGASKMDVLDGITRYKQHLEKNKTEPRFIKQGSTWFNQECWKDVYIEAPASKSNANEIDQDYLDYLDSLTNK